MSKIVNGEYSEGRYYREVPIFPGATAQLVISEEDPYDLLEIEFPDEESESLEFSPTAVLTGEEMEDITPPQTTISLSGEETEPMIFLGTSTIALSAEDNAGGSGVLLIEYKLDGGEWQAFSEAIPLTASGTHEIIFSSIDRAGNREADKSATFAIIDKVKKDLLLETIAYIQKAKEQGLIKKEIASLMLLQLQTAKKTIEKYETEQLPAKKEILRAAVLLNLKIFNKALDLYKQYQWVKLEAYAIIKNNINSLIKKYEK
jgi:hypothetical protein